MARINHKRPNNIIKKLSYTQHKCSPLNSCFVKNEWESRDLEHWLTFKLCTLHHISVSKSISKGKV